jgi:hypothetical protein
LLICYVVLAVILSQLDSKKAEVQLSSTFFVVIWFIFIQCGLLAVVGRHTPSGSGHQTGHTTPAILSLARKPSSRGMRIVSRVGMPNVNGTMIAGSHAQALEFSTTRAPGQFGDGAFTVGGSTAIDIGASPTVLTPPTPNIGWNQGTINNNKDNGTGGPLPFNYGGPLRVPSIGPALLVPSISTADSFSHDSPPELARTIRGSPGSTSTSTSTSSHHRRITSGTRLPYHATRTLNVGGPLSIHVPPPPMARGIHHGSLSMSASTQNTHDYYYTGTATIAVPPIVVPISPQGQISSDTAASENKSFMDAPNSANINHAELILQHLQRSDDMLQRQPSASLSASVSASSSMKNRAFLRHHSSSTLGSTTKSPKHPLMTGTTNNGINPRPPPLQAITDNMPMITNEHFGLTPVSPSTASISTRASTPLFPPSVNDIEGFRTPTPNAPSAVTLPTTLQSQAGVTEMVMIDTVRSDSDRAVNTTNPIHGSTSMDAMASSLTSSSQPTTWIPMSSPTSTITTGALTTTETTILQQ